MPVADVRDVLVAQNPGERETLIAAHIDHLEAELGPDKAAVNSLRALLNNAASHQPVHRRTESTTPAVAISATVDPTDIENWWREALLDVRGGRADRWFDQTGPAGGLYDECLFQQERGQATVFVPVTTPRELGRIEPILVPAAECAATTHYGSTADIDLAYAELGSYIAVMNSPSVHASASTTTAITLTRPTTPNGEPRSPGPSSTSSHPKRDSQNTLLHLAAPGVIARRTQPTESLTR
jgi:hypothetical protein